MLCRTVDASCNFIQMTLSSAFRIAEMYELNTIIIACLALSQLCLGLWNDCQSDFLNLVTWAIYFKK